MAFQPMLLAALEDERSLPAELRPRLGAQLQARHGTVARDLHRGEPRVSLRHVQRLECLAGAGGRIGLEAHRPEDGDASLGGGVAHLAAGLVQVFR